MGTRTRRVAVAAAALCLLGTDWRTPPRGEGPDSAPVRVIEGKRYIAANDLARLLEATKFWQPAVRKLVLRVGPHAITLCAENPFVVVNERTLWLGDDVISMGGELQVPVVLVDSLPRALDLPRLARDQRRGRVVVLPVSGGVGTPRLVVTPEVTRFVVPADRPDQALVVARARAHLRLRLGGIFTGYLPDSMPPGSLVRSIRTIGSASGSAFECEIAPEATGFRLVQGPGVGRVTLEVWRSPTPDLESFAPEGPVGPRPVRVVVLDPGHGGSDPGVMAGTTVEKELTLKLARMLKPEIERVLGARVVLTRSDDREISADARAEFANRVRADLVLGLHFDGFGHPEARGATAYCPPAIFPEAAAGPSAGRAAGPAPITILPWQDVATRHAVQSRALAEAVLSAFELRGQGPTRLRERLAFDLLGINAPGLLLECATLTSPADRERVTQDAGLRDLAATIVEGMAAYQRNR